MNAEFPLELISDNPRRFRVKPGHDPVFREMPDGGFSVESSAAPMADRLAALGVTVIGRDGDDLIVVSAGQVVRWPVDG